MQCCLCDMRVRCVCCTCQGLTYDFAMPQITMCLWDWVVMGVGSPDRSSRLQTAKAPLMRGVFMVLVH